MQKRIYLAALIMALFLTACAQSSQSVKTTVPPPAPSETQAPTRTQASVTQTAADIVAAPPGCTVASRKRGADPTQESLLPSPSEDDWVKGPDDAYVTIIEYSDFQ